MLTFAVIFSILNIVPNAILSKNKDFKAIGVINVSSNLISGIITIVLAIKGFSYYALVLNSIIRSLLLFTLSYIKCNIKIKKEFKFNSVMKIMNYSIYQFSFSVINYFTRNLDNILIGKFLGAGTLGYYDKAYKLMLYPIQNLTHVITPVLHPILSEYQNEKDVIYNQYIKVIKLLSNIGIFISVYCFFTSKEAIRIMYGNNWDFSIPLFRILSISIVIQMVLSTIGSIFQATGYVNKLFSTGVISAFFTITAITIGIYSKSLYILTIGIVISFVLNFIQSFYVLITKVFKKSFIDFLKIFKNTVIIGIIMIVGYILTRKLQIENVIISAIFKLTIGIVFYGIGLIITGEYKLILRNKYSIYKKKIS